MAVDVFLGIGSNLGDPLANCLDAVRKLDEIRGFSVCSVSSWYRTEPVGYTQQNWFVNGVLKGKSVLSPEELLRELQNIEGLMGRKRTIRWGPRVIDLDILFFGERKVNLPYLKVPHPELHKRRFVLVPLCELAPEWKLPWFNVTACELLKNLSNDGQVVERIELR